MNTESKNFKMVGESFFFDSPTELLLESLISINVKTNNTQLLGKITSCARYPTFFRIGVKLIMPQMPALKVSPSQQANKSPPASPPIDTE
jgi:hypothetical protein